MILSSKFVQLSPVKKQSGHTMGPSHQTAENFPNQLYLSEHSTPATVRLYHTQSLQVKHLQRQLSKLPCSQYYPAAQHLLYTCPLEMQRAITTTQDTPLCIYISFPVSFIYTAVTVNLCVHHVLSVPFNFIPK